MLVLGDYGKRLTCLDVITAVNETLLDISATRSRHCYPTLAARTLHTCICELGSFVFGFGYSEVFLAYYLVLDEYLGTCIVALSTFVVDARTLYGVAVGKLHSG